MDDGRVIELVRTTRDMLLPHWGSIEAQKKDFEGGDVAQSTVTELDRKIEKYLKSALNEIDSSIAFAGEEYGGSRDEARFWLCDPIDGTMHFVRGLPFCSVMLALIEEGRVNFSIVYDFINDHLYHARRGGGAYMNGAAIRVSDRALDGGYLAFETRTPNAENAALVRRVRARANLMETVTSGYEYALVASGKLDGRICYDPWGKDYDFAPGSLLVEEAGGVVANVGSHSYDYRDLNFIAANPRVYEALTHGEGAIFPTQL